MAVVEENVTYLSGNTVTSRITLSGVNILEWSNGLKDSTDPGYWTTKTQISGRGWLYLDGSTVKLKTRDDVTDTKRVYFYNLKSNSNGGAIALRNGAEVKLENVEFTQCAASYGGVISLESNSTASLQNVNITGGSATNHGGAFFVNASTLDLQNVDITGVSSGAAVSIWNKSKVTLQDCSISGSTSASRGGAIALAESATIADVTLKNVKITGNTVTGGYGGGLFVQGENTVTVSDSIFSGNVSAYNYGGAVCVYSNADKSTVTFTNVVFDGNIDKSSQSFTGGAISIVSGIVTINSCTFKNNTGKCSTTGSKQESSIGMNGGVLILQGQNTFDNTEGKKQYINNIGGEVYFDLSVSTAADANKAILNDYSLLYRYNNGTGATSNAPMITVSSNQMGGTYVIAKNYIKGSTAGTASGNKTNSFRLKVGSNTQQVLGTFDANATNTLTKTINGTEYTLKVNEANDLVLVVDNIIYVNTEWVSGSTITGQSYHGYETAGGTCSIKGVTASQIASTTRYFNDYATAVDFANLYGRTIVGKEEKTPSYASSIQLQGARTDLTQGNYSKMIVGGSVNAETANGCQLTISGGAYASNVIGSGYASTTAVTETNSSEMTITGGTFSKVVCGGAYSNGAMATLSGSKLAISGGTFTQRVYGGNYAKTENATSENSVINGNVTVTVDCSSNAIVFGDGITVGSRGKDTGMIDGNTSITFTGNGSNLTFGNGSKVWGGCTGDTRKIKTSTGEVTVTSGVTGTRSLVFDKFTSGASTFSATVGLFTDLKVINESSVNFAGARLGDVERWFIDDDCSISGLGINDFTGDTLDLYGQAGETLITGTDMTAFNGLTSASAVNINGKACELVTKGENKYWSCTDANLKVSVADNKLSLAKLA